MGTIICWSLLLGLVPAILAANPGVKLRITQKGLDYAATHAIKSLSLLQGKPIPDIRGSDIKLKVGKLKDYSFTNFKISNFETPHSDLSIQPGRGIHWSIQGASIRLTGNWHYHYKIGLFPVKDSTSFDLDVKNAGINIMIAFGESGGKPTIHADECSANVESVDIKLHGGKSWLYNLFRDKIAHVIKDKLKSLLCEEASKVVDKDAEKALAKLKLVVDIRKAVVLDYTMQSDPILEQGYIESYHKGEIFWSGSHKEAPFQPRVFPQSFDTSKMAYIWVSDYLLNTAGYALQNQGILQYYLGPRDLKPKDRHYLYTTCPQQQCIGKLINKLQNGFPNCEIYINMSTSIAPTIRIMNGQIFGNVQGAMTYYARLPNNTVKYLFMTAVNINVFLTASVHDNKITARVTSISPNVTVLDSQIGLISSTALTSILSNLGDSLLIPKLNELGAEGLPLPRSEQVAFKNPTLNLVKNAIVLGTDLAWHPQNVDLNKTTEGVDNNLYFNSKKSGESPIGARTNTLNVARDWSKGTAHHSFKKLFG